MEKILKGLKKNLKNKKGFTLIELVVVIAVLGMISTIAIPKVGDITSKAKANADAQTVAILNNALETYVAESGDTTIYNKTDYTDVLDVLIDGAPSYINESNLKITRGANKKIAKCELPSGAELRFDKKFKK